MEPVSLGIGALIWKVAIEPVVNSYQESYGDTVKDEINNLLGKALDKLPFNKKEAELIEAEIVEADISILDNEEKFVEFIANNKAINEILLKHKKVIIGSLLDIENSSIEVGGEEKTVVNSFKNIKDSQIKL